MDIFVGADGRMAQESCSGRPRQRRLDQRIILRASCVSKTLIVLVLSRSPRQQRKPWKRSVKLTETSTLSVEQPLGHTFKSSLAQPLGQTFKSLFRRYKSSDSLDGSSNLYIAFTKVPTAWTHLQIFTSPPQTFRQLGRIFESLCRRHKSSGSLDASSNLYFAATKVPTAWRHLRISTSPLQKFRHLGRRVYNLGQSR